MGEETKKTAQEVPELSEELLSLAQPLMRFLEKLHPHYAILIEGGRVKLMEIQICTLSKEINSTDL